VSRAPNFNALWGRAIAQELSRAGVQHVVVSPGSRSAPLALALAEESGVRVHVVLDERSAAFVALGAAKASGRPAAVLATSGSAGAHFLPAVLEAEAAGIPLVAITADRPIELHGFGAPQTVDQQRLFGAHVVEFADLGTPEPMESRLLHLRAVVSRAVQRSVLPRPGPVHLNAPFREPLAPVVEPLPEGLSPLAVDGRAGERFSTIEGTADQPSSAATDRAAASLLSRPRGVIVCGPRDRDDGLTEAVSALAAATGYPVLAEAVSNVRAGFAGAVTSYDLLLRHEPLAAALKPEAVVRIGAGLTSKVLQAWLDGSGAWTVALSDRGALFDPAHATSLSIEGDAAASCRALAERMAPHHLSGPLAQAFAKAEARARAALEASFADGGDTFITEPRIAREVAAALPEGALLFASSSMPIRDIDAFAPAGSRARVLANRGLNGIDGIVSSAAGAALACARPTAVLLGDLALLHDLGGLIAARRLGVPLVLVVPNNDGGGIFHFLPIALHAGAAAFEQLFGTPHGIDLAAVAALAGAALHRPRTADELRIAVRESLGSGIHLLEVKTDRAANVAAHRELQQAVQAALGGAGWQ
jgi:2-succinyl-5-enolpyruvyl-6-hydroxy-3-cyclohexene-1-carboxylate synthase